MSNFTICHEAYWLYNTTKIDHRREGGDITRNMLKLNNIEAHGPYIAKLHSIIV